MLCHSQFLPEHYARFNSAHFVVGRQDFIYEEVTTWTYILTPAAIIQYVFCQYIQITWIYVQYFCLQTTGDDYVIIYCFTSFSVCQNQR